VYAVFVRFGMAMRRAVGKFKEGYLGERPV